jgi:hypothetical protein
LSKIEERTKLVRGVSFEWETEHPKIKNHSAIVFKEAFSGKSYGFIAQEVEEIVPEVVDTDDEGYKSMHYGPLVSLGLANLQINQRRINSIYDRINKLTEIMK